VMRQVLPSKRIVRQSDVRLVTVGEVARET